MCQTKVLKNLFLLILPYLVWVRFAGAELNTNVTDSPVTAAFAAVAEAATTPLAIATAVAAASDKSGVRTDLCPYNQICTDDIVLITMQTDLSPLGKKLTKTNVKVARDANDLSKGYDLIREQEGSGFNGFYYWVRPGKTYYFRATYYYAEGGNEETQLSRFSESIYYKSRYDVHNPGSADEGPISPSVAKLMGLPPIPKCKSVKSPGQFCTNQIVHVFWSNDRGSEKSVAGIDLYINSQFVKHGRGSYYDDGGHFKDFFYVLPDSKYTGLPVSFTIKWSVLNQRKFPFHIENSETLVSRYTPEWAFACRPTDTWEKCQNYWQDRPHQ